MSKEMQWSELYFKYMEYSHLKMDTKRKSQTSSELSIIKGLVI